MSAVIVDVFSLVNLSRDGTAASPAPAPAPARNIFAVPKWVEWVAVGFTIVAYIFYLLFIYRNAGEAGLQSGSIDFPMLFLELLLRAPAAAIIVALMLFVTLMIIVVIFRLPGGWKWVGLFIAPTFLCSICSWIFLL